MLNFRLATLNSAEATPDVLAAWELAAFFLGEASPKDLPMDEDEGRKWYIGEIVDDDTKADYYAEPQLADAEMAESFANALRDFAVKRKSELGEHYPFVLGDNDQLIRRTDRALDTVGASYLSLQFFRGLTGGTIEVDGESDAVVRQRRDAFERNFRNVFEYIAGYAISGRKNGAPFQTSHCRSAQRLEGLLGNVCRKIGAGDVLPYDRWNRPQRAANDGGVDCLVHIGGPAVPGDAEIALVGATIQKAKIGTKIMGPEKVDFFRSFFSTQPAAFRGVLVRPQDEDALTKEKCVQKDCLLYSYDQVWQSMGKRAGGEYQAQMLLRLDAKVRHLLHEFLGSAFLYEYEEYLHK